MSSRLAALVVLVTAVLLVAVACSSDDETVTETLRISPPPSESAPVSVVETVAKILGFEASEDDNDGLPPACPDDPTRELNVTGLDSRGYAFDPGDFTFSVGDCVEFTFTAESEFHTFTVDDLGIDQDVDVDAPVTFAFTFGQAGTFPLICIPHELNGMVGTITVN